MSKRKVDDSLANLKKAMDRLREALEVPRTDPLVVEGTIQRFEFVIEIFWKALRRALEYSQNTERELETGICRWMAKR